MTTSSWFGTSSVVILAAAPANAAGLTPALSIAAVGLCGVSLVARLAWSEV
jgi:hypothetical protein